MNNIQMLSIINNFPVGEIPNNRKELLSKAEVIAYLARFQEQFFIIENPEEREMLVKKFLEEILLLDNDEFIPNIEEAIHTLRIKKEFLSDYNKIQYLKENNPNFNSTYNAISQYLNIEPEISNVSR